MVDLQTLADYTNTLLDIGRFKDYCPNGIQIEGSTKIKTLVSGVTANQALIRAARDLQANALLVHHGYFWKGENPALTGMKQRRIKALLESDISLLAYHLPLDAHPDYGNNAALAAQLGLQIDGVVDKGPAKDILFYGRLPNRMAVTEVNKHIEARLGRPPLIIEADGAQINTVAWCTGAAQGFIEQAIALKVDAYLSGEVSEQTTHIAREAGIHFIAAGHHATERYGPMRLGEHLAQKFGIEHHFIDIENPV